MNHPIVFYQLAKIKQADMWREADAQRLAHSEMKAPALPIRSAALMLVITALAGVLKLLIQ